MQLLFSIKFLFLLSLATLIQAASKPCQKRDYGNGSPVCVCSSTYCDEIEPIGKISATQAVIYESSEGGKRLERSTIEWGNVKNSTTDGISVKINPSKTYQKIFGFGGAFTDAAGINVKSLSAKTQQKFIEAYFAPTGIEYNIGRIPMASCDYSTHEYSYDDVDGDLNLTNFKLTKEDLELKIPFIKQAQQLSGNKLRLFGSPWSPPAWMKTNKLMHSNGTLIGKPGGPYYKAWANYFVKFLQAYESKNISIWGLTAQNEPMSGFVYNYGWQTCGFTAEMQRDFIKMDLGPALHKAGYENVALMIMDDQRIELPKWAQTVLADKEAAKYVSGIALHWYWDWFMPAAVLSETHKEYPEFWILGTEACNGEMAYHAPLLGSWYRGELYAHDIIEDLNNFVVGWTDWNLALDLRGGPNWAKNFDDAPVIVSKTADEFYKQPMYYAMGHFSKFLPIDSRRMDVQVSPAHEWISVTGFSTPDSNRVLLLLNRGLDDYVITVTEAQRSDNLKITLKSHSLITVIWGKQ